MRSLVAVAVAHRTADTSTVYSKGAEVVGLYKTWLGSEGFKKGLKLYFDRHDGSAVTCDDFRNAMAGKVFLFFSLSFLSPSS